MLRIEPRVSDRAFGFWRERVRRCHIPGFLFVAISIHLLDVAHDFPRQAGTQTLDVKRTTPACRPVCQKLEAALALIALQRPAGRQCLVTGCAAV